MARPIIGRVPLKGLIFHALAALVLALAVLHAATVQRTLALEVVEAAIPATMAVALVLGGRAVDRENLSRHGTAVMLAITLAFAVVAAVIAGIILLIQILESAPTAEPGYVLFVAWTGGAAVGTPVGYFAVKNQRVVDELSANHEELRTLNQRLSISQRVFRHNLRNDLTVLLGFTEVLSEDPRSENAPDLIAGIQARHERLLGLAEELAALERIWAAERTTVDLSGRLQALLARLPAEHSDIGLDVDVADSLVVETVPQIEVAIAEAIENAMGHNDVDELHLQVRAGVAEDRDGFATVEVVDDGSGIPAFESDVIGGGEETALEHGTGLGLWLIHFAAEQSGGHVEIEDRDPHGAVVRFVLPLAGEGPEPEQGSLLEDTERMLSRMAAIVEEPADGDVERKVASREGQSVDADVERTVDTRDERSADEVSTPMD